ncbi:MAG: MiaB/RimO family radical SAM methylthiotransferase, partial [Candidatus Wildermuthbacteria bacterium]|nr:MiaB/RimO family radical SAM methylthiotransferase [Candidatus Wildermuthbacteria bacterium]
YKLKTILTGCILPADKKKFLNKFDSISNTKNLFKRYHGLVRGTIYVPISNGCNNTCSYCAVPLTRGPLVCRDHQEIIKEVENVVKSGLKEVWLLGQNVNNYQSPANPKINFAKLLRLANDIPGNFKIRFMSPHPAYFTDELIEVMAKCPKVAHYLNLPAQSGDNQILTKMGRPYTVEQYKNLVKKIIKKIPDINLSTDIIVGFPGETKKQFANTVKLFKKIKFNIAYISKYSPRPGTMAAKMKDNVSIKEKKRRWKILNSLLS